MRNIPSRRAALLPFLLCALATPAMAMHGSSGVIQFVGKVYMPTTPVIIDTAGYSVGTAPAQVSDQPVAQVAAATHNELMAYFASYASPTAKVVTTAYR